MVGRKRKPLATKNINVVSSELDGVARPVKANTAKGQMIIEELDAEVRNKCEEMRQAGEDAAVQIRNEYAIQLMLIKTDVRKMTLLEFGQVYDGDIDPALLERIDHCLQICRPSSGDGSDQPPPAGRGGTVLRISRRGRAAAPPSTARRALRSRALQTPARASAKNGVPGTARLARLGELLISQETGSPVEFAAATGMPDITRMVPGTVVRPAAGALPAATAGGGYATMFVQKRRGKTKATQGGPGILVTLNDGCQVMVTNRQELKTVPPEMQAEVKAQLQQWHATASSLLQASPPAGPAGH